MTERVDKAAMACNKPKRTPGHPEKSHIVKACYDGKEKIIRFGEQGKKVGTVSGTAGKPKAGESDRMKAKRKSFKARHAKNIAKGPSSAAYWANKVKWADGGHVELSKMLADYEGADDVRHLVQKFKTGGQPKKDAEPGLMDYLKSVANTVTSLPEAPAAIYNAGKEFVQAIPRVARTAAGYINNTPLTKVGQDMRGGLNAVARQARQNPVGAAKTAVSTALDVIPVIGDIKAYGQDVSNAARMRARGDVSGAQNIERMALPLAIASIAPGVGEARMAGKAVRAAEEAVDVADDIKQLTRRLVTKPERGPVRPGPNETEILYRGSSPAEGRYPINKRGATWFSSNPDVASSYAHEINNPGISEGAAVTPVRLKYNPYSYEEIDAAGRPYYNIDVTDIFGDTDMYNDHMMDLEDLYGEDARGMRVTGTDSLADIAAENGIDVVRIKNVLDPGPGVNLPQYSHVATTPADTYVAMSQDNIIPMAGRMNERKTNLDRFLKESIMKDEAGDPVVLFHGTSDDISGNFNLYHPNRKDQGWLGRGAYVTDAPEMASMYANMKAGKEGPNVMPLYGDIRNPYHMTLEDKNKLRFLPQDAIDDFTYKLRDAGHDSAIVTYPDGTREIAVFNPERQLKSASGNRGTYDPENPDLKFAEGGAVKFDLEEINQIISDIMQPKDVGPVTLTPEYTVEGGPNVSVDMRKRFGPAEVTAHKSLRGGADYGVDFPLLGGDVSIGASADKGFVPNRARLSYRRKFADGGLVSTYDEAKVNDLADQIREGIYG